MSATVHPIPLRSSTPDVRNPLLKLSGAEAFTPLGDDDRRQLRALLDGIRRAAKVVADGLWRRGRVRRAAYWRACSVYAGHAARLAHSRPSAVVAVPLSHAGDGPNPLLTLPGAKQVRDLSPAAGAALVCLLLDLRQDAKLSSGKSWRTAKSPMAAYWADVATYAGHCARFVRMRTRVAAEPLKEAA